jgi:FAD/FMN-containing dehydrogenase
MSSTVARGAAAQPLVLQPGLVVNDIHSQLNPTHVAAIAVPATIGELSKVVTEARESGRPIAIAGGRHSMGGQQFGHGCTLVDTRELNRVISFDRDRGLIDVEGGIQWPALVEYLSFVQPGHETDWGIVQKQTGADRLTLGGALSCNAHGRGLALKPIVDQVESFELMDATGCVRCCSRTERADLFRLAIGGYGLFGVMTRVGLRLGRKQKVRRVVEVIDTTGLADRFEERIRAGFLYGDFQFAIDATADDFLRRGVFACYEPVPFDTPLTEAPASLRPEQWQRLVLDAHVNKPRAFEEYSRHYLGTSGQIYWADAQLGSPYVDDYHSAIDLACGATVPGSEMITEVYVPRHRLTDFLESARRELADRRANVIYGTVRLIERDDETFLTWARDRFACIVFNLHVDHTPGAIAATAETFRALIDLAVGHGGSYYLTYHRWARKDQVEACYPQMRRFLEMKRRHDPEELFQSEWYRHYRAMFQESA